MDKRQFLTHSALLGAASVALPGLALAAAPVAGKDYRLVNPPQRTNVAPGKVEVIEFFWYACPHCYGLEPVVHDWLKSKPADVEFRRVHVAFRGSQHQQIYYTLLAMGKADELGGKVFSAIHDERKRMTDTDEIVSWAKAQGLDEKAFLATFNSFGVSSQMKKASQAVEAYGVDGVPAFAVNGKFYTSPSMVGSNGRVIEVVNQLVEQSR